MCINMSWNKSQGIFNGVILSRNTCHKIGSNGFEKKKSGCVHFVCNGKAEEAEKIAKLGLGWKLGGE